MLKHQEDRTVDTVRCGRSRAQDLFNSLKFFLCEGEVVQGFHAFDDLIDGACSDQSRRNHRLAKNPCDSHLCQGLPALYRKLVECSDPGKPFPGHC